MLAFSCHHDRTTHQTLVAGEPGWWRALALALVALVRQLVAWNAVVLASWRAVQLLLVRLVLPC
jgi:hypothetical protein